VSHPVSGNFARHASTPGAGQLDRFQRLLGSAAEALAAPTRLSLRTGGRTVIGTPGAFSNPTRQLPLPPGSLVLVKLNKRPRNLLIRYRRAPQALYARPWRIDSGHLWVFQIKKRGRGPLSLYAVSEHETKTNVFSFKVRRDADAQSAGFGFIDICQTDYFSWMGLGNCRAAKRAGEVILDVKEDVQPYVVQCSKARGGGLKLSKDPPYVRGFRPKVGFWGCVDAMILESLGL
jgi:hypothetical protein